MDPKQSRGFRNKNPGNIDWNPRNKWQGQVGKEDHPSARFAVFETHEYGIRALAMLLITYQDRHGLRTINGIINRWAPTVENNTNAYAQHVARLTGFGVDEPLNLQTYEHMRPLVEAIITHELGGQPYAGSVIDEGLRMAGIPKPVGTMREAATTGTGRAAIQVGSVTAAAAAAAPAIEAISSLPQWVGVALVIAVAAVAVVFVLAQRRK